MRVNSPPLLLPHSPRLCLLRTASLRAGTHSKAMPQWEKAGARSKSFHPGAHCPSPTLAGWPPYAQGFVIPSPALAKAAPHPTFSPSVGCPPSLYLCLKKCKVAKVLKIAGLFPVKSIYPVRAGVYVPGRMVTNLIPTPEAGRRGFLPKWWAICMVSATPDMLLGNF